MLGEKAILGESMAIDRLRLGDNSELFPRTRSKVWLIDNRIMQKVQASSTKFPTGTHTLGVDFSEIFVRASSVTTYSTQLIFSKSLRNFTTNL